MTHYTPCWIIAAVPSSRNDSQSEPVFYSYLAKATFAGRAHARLFELASDAERTRRRIAAGGSNKYWDIKVIKVLTENQGGRIVWHEPEELAS